VCWAAIVGLHIKIFAWPRIEQSGKCQVWSAIEHIWIVLIVLIPLKSCIGGWSRCQGSIESSLGRNFILSYRRSLENFGHRYISHQQPKQGNLASRLYMSCRMLSARVLRLVGCVLVMLWDFFFVDVYVDIVGRSVSVYCHQQAVCKRSGVSLLLPIPCNTLLLALGRSPASRMPTYGCCLGCRFSVWGGVRSGGSVSVGRPRKVPRWCPGYIRRLLEGWNEVATLTGGWFEKIFFWYVLILMLLRNLPIIVWKLHLSECNYT